MPATNSSRNTRPTSLRERPNLQIPKMPPPVRRWFSQKQPTPYPNRTYRCIPSVFPAAAQPNESSGEPIFPHWRCQGRPDRLIEFPIDLTRQTVVSLRPTATKSLLRFESSVRCRFGRFLGGVSRWRAGSKLCARCILRLWHASRVKPRRMPTIS